MDQARKEGINTREENPILTPVFEPLFFIFGPQKSIRMKNHL